MRALLGLAGLLLALAVVGVLLKKQLAPVQTPAPGGTIQASRPVQQSVQQAVEAAVQAPRPVSDDQ